MDTDMITNRREHEIRKSIITAYKHIKKRFRLELEQQFFGPEGKTVMDSKRDDIKKKAAAWYAVCYQNLHHGQPYTFAWIAYDYICELAASVRTSPVQEKRVVLPAVSPHDAAESSPDVNDGNHGDSLVDFMGGKPTNPWSGVAHPNMMEMAMVQERARVALESKRSTETVDGPSTQSTSSVISPSIRLPFFEAVEYPMPPPSDLPHVGSTTLGPLRGELRAKISHETGGYLTVGPDASDDQLFKALNFS